MRGLDRTEQQRRERETAGEVSYKLCWPALSNETWNLPCSKELGRHRNEVGWWGKGVNYGGRCEEGYFP